MIPGYQTVADHHCEQAGRFHERDEDLSRERAIMARYERMSSRLRKLADRAASTYLRWLRWTGQ